MIPVSRLSQVGHLQGQQFLTAGSRVQYVICVRGRIADVAAIEFSRGFYSALAKGKSISDSYTHGCAALLSRFGRASREKQVEDANGVPQMCLRRTGDLEQQQSQERFRFSVELILDILDVRLKSRLHNYLVTFLQVQVL